MLLLCYYRGSIGDELIWEVSGIFYNPFLLSLGLCMTIFTLHLIVTSCALNTAMNPAPHRFTI